MRWAKTRPRVTYDLASSGLQPVTTEELLGDARREGRLRDLRARTTKASCRCATPSRRATACRAIASRLPPARPARTSRRCLALLQPGDDALIETPAYDPLIAAARAAGANVVHFERSWDEGLRARSVRRPHRADAGDEADRDLERAQSERRDGGSRRARADRRDGRGDRRAACWSTRSTPKRSTTTRRCRRRPRDCGDVFVTTNSLTKAYGLAGLRCGWILASPQVSERIREMRDIVDGSGPFVAERLAVTAFAQIDRLRARARAILSENLALVRAMAESNPRLEWLEPAAGTTAFPRVKRRRRHRRARRSPDSRPRHHRRARTLLPGAAAHLGLHSAAGARWSRRR